MAAPTYTSDLSTNQITNCEGTETWIEFTGALGGDIPTAELDFYIQGSGCYSSDTNRKTGLLSGAFNNGTPITFAAGECFFGWSVVLPGNAMDTYSAGGIRQAIGASASDYTWWPVGGSDYGRNPYGGWQNTVVDPTNTATATDVGGGTGTSYQYFGFIYNLVAIIEKGSPLGWDAMYYGRGDAQFGLGDDVGGGHGVFSGMAAVNDNQSNRWGIFQAQGTGYLWKGLMSFGTAGAACWFEDSNVAITIDDTPATYADFNRIEINNAGSTVIWKNILISAVNPGGLAVGNFEMIDNATVEFTSCIFNDMGTFIFDSNADVAGCSWNKCGLITLGGATFTGCVFNSSTSAAGVSAASGAEAALVSGATFQSDGTGYGMTINGAATDFTFTNNTWTGYASTNGTTGNEAIHITATTGTFNITKSGGTTPTYHTEGATVNILDNVTVNVTVKSGSALVGNCAVAAFRDSDNFELVNELTPTSGINEGKVSFSVASDTAFTVRARKNSPGDTRYYPTEQSANSGATGTSLTISLVRDTIAI